jgi:hypothetical protein
VPWPYGYGPIESAGSRPVRDDGPRVAAVWDITRPLDFPNLLLTIKARELDAVSPRKPFRKCPLNGFANVLRKLWRMTGYGARFGHEP